ncbi:DNA sulfur modification protein DndB [Sporosarcina obsidiansis]|uniref:DNA sulfur modification protein DndB n=1 Tax=Sporosarcina obsidiansis TaxID=2660748 RepID=UPI001E5D7593|nr:DNA sulfur modification protein DndB [Sporosarcina obsidiansis]
MHMTNSGMMTTMSGVSYEQFGKEVLCTQIRFSMLDAVFEVDHEVQRQLDPRKRKDIRNYILECLEKGEPFYFSPFVFSSRGNIKETSNGFNLKPGSKLYVLDAQHRTSALSSAVSHLKSRKEAAEEAGNWNDAKKVQGYLEILTAYPVTVQIYLNLNQQQERQLFTDLNAERKEAHPGLLLQYDQRDKYTELTRSIANELQLTMEIEHKRSRLTEQNTAITSLITMRKCLLAMFEGILTVKTGDPYFRGCKERDVPEIAKAFFTSWQQLFPKKMNDRKKYACGVTGVQVALAYTVYMLMREQSISHMEAIQLTQLLKKKCTWKHDDPAFKHMYDKESGQVRNHSNSTAVKRTMKEFLLLIHEERKRSNAR